MSGPADDRRLDHAIRRWIEASAGSFLVAERWFGDKTRPIASTSVADLAFAAVGDESIGLILVDVDFRDGGKARYVLPVAVTRDPPAGVRPWVTVDSDGSRHVVDALALPRGRAWLLEQFATETTRPAADGAFVWRKTDHLAAGLSAARTGASRMGTAEQSNTSVVYGASLILKTFRKVEPGINPEVEIARFLTAETDFRHVPLLAGDWSYLTTEGEPIALDLIQSFVPNAGDGWAFTLDLLDATPTDDLADAYRPVARRLGARTGQLHLALAGRTNDPAFAPEPVTDGDIAGWIASFRGSLRRTGDALRAHADRVPADLADQVATFFAAQDGLVSRIDGFERLRGATKCRVHGDLHLGQALRTPDDDFVFLDFEGEPARPLAERRAKTSPLKDVAGMLNSFAYARATAARAHGHDSFVAWERAAREAFIEGYAAETAARGASFLPHDRAAFDAALAAWELDKAVYEITYELNNRPDWLAIPLAATVR